MHMSWGDKGVGILKDTVNVMQPFQAATVEIPTEKHTSIKDHASA